jgi:hypothetical protein
MNDRGFENQMLTSLVRAQVREDEARAFRAVLGDVIRRIEAILSGTDA